MWGSAAPPLRGGASGRLPWEGERVAADGRELRHTTSDMARLDVLERSEAARSANAAAILARRPPPPAPRRPPAPAGPDGAASGRPKAPADAPAPPAPAPAPARERRVAAACAWHGAGLGAAVAHIGVGGEAGAVVVGTEGEWAGCPGLAVLAGADGGRRAAGLDGHDVRCVQPTGGAPGEALVATAAGVVFRFGGPGGAVELFRVPRAAPAAAAAAPVPAEAGAEAAGDDGSPAYVRESGFRGHRDGFVFMAGTLGVGYYRVDVHSQYRAAEKLPAVGEAAAAPNPPDLTGRPIRAFAFSADLATLYTGSPVGGPDAAVNAWCVATGAWRGAFEGHEKNVLCLAVAPGALFSGGYDRDIRQWSTADRTCASVLKGHTGSVQALAASGGKLFSCSADGTIREWDLAKGICWRVFTGQHDKMTWPICMSVCAERRLLATGSRGPHGASNAKVWDIDPASRPGTCLATVAQLPFEQGGAIGSLAFAPGGARLYTGASDGTVAAWDLAEAEAEPAAGQVGAIKKGFLSRGGKKPKK